MYKRARLESAIRARMAQLKISISDARINLALDAILANPTLKGIGEAVATYLPSLSVVNEAVDSTDVNFWIQRIRDIANEKK
jgi:hypothetical protein